jgi:hypothetical protein
MGPRPLHKICRLVHPIQLKKGIQSLGVIEEIKLRKLWLG